jgi:hypothetical protein
MLPRTLFPAAVIASLVSVASTPACGGSGANAPNRPLPSYVGHATELFDDAIEPKAVGLELETTTAPKMDARLRERAEVGDAVLRARVSTVTAKEEDSGTVYQVGFETLEKLAGPYPPGDDFGLRVDKGTPSMGILKSFQGRLVGKSFVVFVRLFVRPDGDKDMHFHVAPDTKEEVAAVRAATVKQEF